MTEPPFPPNRSKKPQKSGWIRFKRMAARIWQRQRADHVVYLTASLAYFTLLALVPISAISLSVIAAFFNEEKEEIFDMVTKAVLPFDEQLLIVKQGRDPSTFPDELLPATGETIRSPDGSIPVDSTVAPRDGHFDLGDLHEEFKGQMRGFVAQASGLGPIGLVFLVITGYWLFDSIEDAFNSIWRVQKRRPFIRKFTIFWAILTLTPLLMVGPVFINRYVETKTFAVDLDLVWGVVSFLLTWFAIWLLYMLVPNGNVAFRPAAISSCVVAILWDIAKRGFAEYVVRSESYATIYGSLGLILIVLAWIYYTWLIVLAGLEVTAYLQYPDWDQATPYDELAPEISLLYSWGALYQVGKAFLTGEGGTTTDSVSASLGLDQARVNRLLHQMEDKGLLVHSRDGGNWYPSLALEQVTWAEVAAKLEYDLETSDVSLSEWLEAALRARGLVGYRQETENLPSLDRLLKNKMGDSVVEAPALEEPGTATLVLEAESGEPPEITD